MLIKLEMMVIKGLHHWQSKQAQYKLELGHSLAYLEVLWFNDSEDVFRYNC